MKNLSSRVPTQRLVACGWASLGVLGLLIGLTLVPGCATDIPGDRADTSRFEFPSGLALHPNGRYLYVVNANFDLRYRAQDGGILSVVDLEAGEILAESSRTMGSFATLLTLNHDASRGYVVARGDNALQWFAISPDGREIFCPLAPDARDLGACRVTLPAEPTSIAYTRTSRRQPLLDGQGRPLLGEDGEALVVERHFDLLALAHLRNGMVSVVTVGDAEGVRAPAFSLESAALIEGGSDVVHLDGERFYVTGRVATAVVGFRPGIGPDAKVLGIYTESVIGVPTPFTSYEGRALQFSEDKRRLYLLSQGPDALMVIDVSASDPYPVSGARARVIGILDLPRDPVRMALVKDSAGQSWLYVTSFREDVVAVVDPELLAVVARVPVGDGPFDIIVDGARQRAYVGAFRDHGVTVLDTSDGRAPVVVSTIGGPGARQP